MYCQFCGNTMIWNSDFDTQDVGIEEEGILSYYTCPHCDYTYAIYDIEDNIYVEVIKNED